MKNATTAETSLMTTITSSSSKRLNKILLFLIESLQGLLIKIVCFYKDDFPKLDLSGKEIDEDSKFLFSLFKDDLIEFKTKGNVDYYLYFFL
jgi:hypothetical protein